MGLLDLFRNNKQKEQDTNIENNKESINIEEAKDMSLFQKALKQLHMPYKKLGANTTLGQEHKSSYKPGDSDNPSVFWDSNSGYMPQYKEVEETRQETIRDTTKELKEVRMLLTEFIFRTDMSPFDCRVYAYMDENTICLADCKWAPNIAKECSNRNEGEFKEFKIYKSEELREMEQKLQDKEYINAFLGIEETYVIEDENDDFDFFTFDKHRPENNTFIFPGCNVIIISTSMDIIKKFKEYFNYRERFEHSTTICEGKRFEETKCSVNEWNL